MKNRNKSGGIITVGAASFFVMNVKVPAKRLWRQVAFVIGIIMLFTTLTACTNNKYLAAPDDIRVSTTTAAAAASRANSGLKNASRTQALLQFAQNTLVLLANRNFDAMSSVLTPQSLSNKSFAEIMRRQKTIDNVLSLKKISYELSVPGAKLQLSNFTLDDGQSPKKAQLALTCVLDTTYQIFKRPLTLNYSYAENEQNWYLDYAADLIFPGLTETGDLVREAQKARRGTIFDCHHKAMALDVDGYLVGIVPQNFAMSNVPKVAKLLSLSADEINGKLSASWVKPDSFVDIVTLNKLDNADKKALTELGVSLEIKKVRFYPFGASAFHLIGYVGDISAEELSQDRQGVYTSESKVGISGLEQLLEADLRGRDGFKIVLQGLKNEVIYEQRKQNGKDFNLTIDAAKQNRVYQKLKDDEGQALALDPKTGEIRMLLSLPACDPNLFVQGISDETYQSYLSDPRLPLYNKFLQNYAPGSTMKVVTAMAALASGSITEDLTMTIKGKTYQEDASWGDYSISRVVVDDSEQNIEDALTNSDNIFFAKIALKMGSKKYKAALQKLTVTENIPPEPALRGESLFEKASISPSGEFADGVELATVAYGQGKLSMSAVQLASIYGALLNDGNIMAPSLFATKKPRVFRANVISAKHIAFLQHCLERVVERNYGTLTHHDFLRLAGKSGTVEAAYDEKMQQYALDSWYAAFDLTREDIVVVVQEQNVHRDPKRVKAVQRVGEIFDLWYD